MSQEELVQLIDELNGQQVQPADGKGKPLKLVPYLGVIKGGTLRDLADLERFSEGQCVVSKEMREGVVLRAGEDISFKVINPKYLLRHDL